MRTFNKAISAAIAASCVAVASADVLRVPGDFPTMQSALDAAKSRDEIVVADGVWTGQGNRDLDIGDKDVTLRSENGPDNCIIDGEDAHRFIANCSNRSRSMVIEGFTVRNGRADTGGAILLYRSGPAIRNCVFEHCIATSPGQYDGGGAIKADTSCFAAVESCTFRGNSSEKASGGAVYGYYKCSFSISDCVFEGNAALGGYSGGAVFTTSMSGAAFARCTFRDNWADGWGGAVTHASNGAVKSFDRCIFEDNSSFSGGALAAFGEASVSVKNSEFRGNSALFTSDEDPATGGAAIVFQDDTVLKFSNCLFAGNRVANDGAGGAVGGAIAATHSSRLSVTGCTFSLNRAEGHEGSTLADGGAIFLKLTTQLTLVNSVLWNNYADRNGSEIAFGDVDGDLPTATVSFSTLTGGREAVYLAKGKLYWKQGNLTSDPRFGNPDAGDFSLAAASPCIDAGDNSAVPDKTLFDLAQRERFVDDPKTVDTGKGDAPIVDLGAYEFSAPPPAVLRGDMDCDAAVNFQDVDGFVAALISRQNYEVEYPGCVWLNGDIDGDESVTSLDIDGFVDCLINGGCE